jgi:excisionase family DNA binding protein
MGHYDIKAPTIEERTEAKKTTEALFPLIGSKVTISVIGENNTQVSVPSSALKLLVVFLENVAEGRAVTIVPEKQDCTTQEAADFLGVSRTFLLDELIKKGVLPYRMIGNRRKIPMSALIEYDNENRAKRQAAIDEMVVLDQKMGIF